MQFHLTANPAIDDAGAAHFELNIERKLVRRLDLSHANALVRGHSPEAAARALQNGLELAGPPVIKLTPAWWPWLPLVPFRVIMSSVP